MKRQLLLASLLSFLLIGALSSAQAQPCSVDSSYSSPGIYPRDTLQDMEVTLATQQVIQFVFPLDTILFGFTLNFDSFKVSDVTLEPNWLIWECNANHPVCLYVSNPPGLTRGCVQVSGTPTAQNPLYPGYDSIIVTGTAYVNVPILGVQPIAQDIPIYYRVGPHVGMGTPLLGGKVSLSPSPVQSRATLAYTLHQGSRVRITVLDLMGREQMTVLEAVQRPGEHALDFRADQLAAGTYLLKIDLGNGKMVHLQKFVRMQ